MEQKEYLIWAVDFDGTLSFGQWPDVGPANKELIQFLKQRQHIGDKIILWTCREADCLENAVKWCTDQGLNFDAVNKNLPERILEYGTDSRKISCDYYIDDRAISLRDFIDWRNHYVQQRVGKKDVEFSYT